MEHTYKNNIYHPRPLTRVVAHRPHILPSNEQCRHPMYVYTCLLPTNLAYSPEYGNQHDNSHHEDDVERKDDSVVCEDGIIWHAYDGWHLSEDILVFLTNQGSDHCRKGQEHTCRARKFSFTRKILSAHPLKCRCAHWHYFYSPPPTQRGQTYMETVSHI